MIVPQPEGEANPSANLDDIFVPGLGVRGALDDDVPHRPWFLPSFMNHCTRMAAFVRRSQEVSRNHLHNIASRSAFAWSNGTRQIQSNLQANVSARASSVAVTLKRIPMQVAGDIRVVATAVRSSTRKWTIVLLPMNTATFKVGQQLRVRLLRARQTARVQLRSFTNLRLPLPQAAAKVARVGHRASLFRQSCATICAKQLRACKVVVDNYGFQKPSLTKLRRAAPAFGILLVVVVFVIQQFVMAAKR
jgi:hypothetical protein